MEKLIRNFANISYNRNKGVIHYTYYGTVDGHWERMHGTKTIENDAYIPDPNLVYDVRMGKEVNGYSDIWNNKILAQHLCEFFKEDNILENNPRKYAADVDPAIKFLSENMEFDEESDQVPELHIHYLDIETKYGEGSFIDAFEVGVDGNRCDEGGIILISSYDNMNKRTHIFSIKPYEDNDDKLPDDCEFIYCESEKKLLEEYNSYLKMYDPDIITGWNISSFDIPYILNRMAFVKGKEKNLNLGNHYCYIKNKYRRFEVYGLSCIDYLPLYKRFELSPRRSYSLSNIAIEENLQVDGNDARKLTYEGSMKEFSEKNWNGFVDYCIQDAKLVYYLEQKRGFLKTLQLLCYMCRCPLNYAVTNDLSWMRLHEASSYDFAKKRGVVVPNKRFAKTEGKFSGAYVMTPTPGIYNNISVFDVASLYPSIIRGLNLSPDTITGEVIDGDIVNMNTPIRARFYDSMYMSLGVKEAVYLERANRYREIQIPTDIGNPTVLDFKNYREFIDCLKQHNMCVAQNGAIMTKEFRGIIPSILDDFFAKRKKYKALAFEARKRYQESNQQIFNDKEERYNSLQGIMKVLLNSFYGVMSCGTFRLHDKRLGEAVTKTGQMIIKGSRDAVEEQGFKVIYIDTDSVFLDYSRKMKERGIERYEDNPTGYRNAVKALDEISIDAINKKMDEISNTLNCENAFAFESEEIFSDIIFSSKKKYLAKYAYDKVTGNDIDKYAVKGLDMKKSGYNAKVKNWLGELSKDILHETPKKVICEKMKNIWYAMKVDELEVVSYSQGVRGIEKYAQDSVIEKYNERKYIVKYANRCPYHVGGALMMNYLVANFPDFHNCDYICEGDKCGVLFVAPDNIFGISNLTYKNYIPRELFDKYFQIDLARTFERLILQPLEPLITAADMNIKISDILGCDLVGKGENMMAQNVLF